MGCLPEESEIDVLSKKMYPEWDLQSLGSAAWAVAEREGSGEGFGRCRVVGTKVQGAINLL